MTHIFIFFKYVSFISVRRFWLLQMCECDKYFHKYFHSLETRERNRRQRVTKSGIYLFCSVKQRKKRSAHMSLIVSPHDKVYKTRETCQKRAELQLSAKPRRCTWMQMERQLWQQAQSSNNSVSIFSSMPVSAWSCRLNPLLRESYCGYQGFCFQ